MTLFSSLTLAFLVGCGEAPIAVGEACPASGETDACVEGAVCTNLAGSDAATAGDENQCMLLCEHDDDCADDEGCRGISHGNLKSCQADDVDG